MTDAVQIIFRTTAGKQIGFGHLRRCLSLAEALRRLGAHSLFLLDGDPAALDQVAEGFSIIPIAHEHDLGLKQIEAAGSKAIVVDSYAFQYEQFHALAQSGTPVIAIDDLAERELPVDLVVNGSAGAEELGYPQDGKTSFLLGPQYALLRPEFAEDPHRVVAQRVKRVLITLGGSDPHYLTSKLVRWTKQALGAVHIDVVIGPLFNSEVQIEPRRSVTVHCNPQGMRALMLAADMALCGGGQTTYELAATGTPAVALRLAENQRENLSRLRRAGTLLWAGEAGDADLERRVTQALANLAADLPARERMSQRGRALVDGRGAARVAQAILQRCLENGHEPN